MAVLYAPVQDHLTIRCNLIIIIIIIFQNINNLLRLSHLHDNIYCLWQWSKGSSAFSTSKKKPQLSFWHLYRLIQSCTNNLIWKVISWPAKSKFDKPTTQIVNGNLKLKGEKVSLILTILGFMILIVLLHLSASGNSSKTCGKMKQKLMVNTVQSTA